MALVVGTLGAEAGVSVDNDSGCFDFVNDTGAVIAAGTVLAFNEAGTDLVFIVAREVAINAVGVGHLSLPARVVLGVTTDAAADVASGVNYTFASATHTFTAAAPGAGLYGVWIALPHAGRNGGLPGGISSTSSAQTAADASKNIRLVQVA